VGDQELSGDAAREAVVKPLTRRSALIGCAALSSAVLAQPEAPALERLRARGRLVVAVYQDLPPFSVGGEGVDVDLARALSKSLDLELSLLPFTAGENMDDDLRNMVWRGHYLGFGPADVMLHAPVEAPLMRNNPRVNIFAPYYRERLVMARELKRVPKGEALADFAGQKIAVAGQSLAGWLMIGADGGAWREQLVTTWKDGAAAARRLSRW
jgi:ABC-type amino acid transport substrate-binding protein